MDGRSWLMMDDFQVTTITKAVIHCWVSGWYRALLISLSRRMALYQGGWIFQQNINKWWGEAVLRGSQDFGLLNCCFCILFPPPLYNRVLPWCSPSSSSSISTKAASSLFISFLTSHPVLVLTKSWVMWTSIYSKNVTVGTLFKHLHNCNYH